MPAHAHRSSESSEPTSSGSVLSSIGSTFQDLIGNNALSDVLLTGDPQAAQHACPHDHEAERPRPPSEGGDSAASDVGAFVGGLLFGPAGAALGAELGQDIAYAVDEAFSDTGLGSDVDGFLEKSPALQLAYDSALEKGYTIQYGEPGKGTRTDPNTKIVYIDPNEKGNKQALAQSMAHELGHVNHEIEPEIGMEGLTREEYVLQNTARHLRDEGEATIMELQVREELMQGDDGFDMGISGMTSEQKKAFWKDYKDGKIDRKDLVDSLAGLFATGEEASTGGTYMDHYSENYKKHWDANHP